MDSSNVENSKEDLFMKQVGNQKKILIFSLDPNLISKKFISLKCKIKTIEPNLSEFSSLYEIDLVDFEQKINQILEKFDIIIVDDFLEYIPNPKKFLKKIKNLLNKTGYIVSSIHNFNHGSVRLSFLDGNFKYTEKFFPKNLTLKFYTLESILILIAESGLKITQLDRVLKDFSDVKNFEFKENIIPKELTDSLLRDSESTSYQYVFSATPYEDKNIDLYSWTTQFSKNLVTNDLLNRINDLKEPTN